MAVSEIIVDGGLASQRLTAKLYVHSHCIAFSNLYTSALCMYSVLRIVVDPPNYISYVSPRSSVDQISLSQLIVHRISPYQIN